MVSSDPGRNPPALGLTFIRSVERAPSARRERSLQRLEPPARSSRKRARARDDVDGEDSAAVQKKKRRLRFGDLVTSPLSQPFSTPSTYIAYRRGGRAGRWLHWRTRGNYVLRKLALLNWSRAQSMRSLEVDHQEAFHTFIDDEADIPQEEARDRPDGDTKENVCMGLPAGLSNYQAIDEEEDQFGEPDDLDELENETPKESGSGSPGALAMAQIS